jgi:GNAT superfamily N-acetyltransferase
VEEIEIKRIGYLDPDAQLLIEAALADLRERYEDDEGDGTPVAPAEFEPPHGAFLVAYVDRQPVASGAWRSHGADGAVAEIKRMYTMPAARGRSWPRSSGRPASTAAAGWSWRPADANPRRSACTWRRGTSEFPTSATTGTSRMSAPSARTWTDGISG